MTGQARLIVTGVVLSAVLAFGCAGSAPAEPIAATAVSLENAHNGAGNADVRFVTARLDADGSWSFVVTVAHPDLGWDDYADGWDIVLSDGTILKPEPSQPFTRPLLHPHQTEQPFTRSQRGIIIPEDETQVIVRAHDLVDGYGGVEVLVDLTAESGPSYVVERPQTSQKYES